MKIPKETIDQIQNAVEIADVIGDFVSLKKKGRYFMACCPFHDEKTPSFTVTPGKGIYKCFGCGKAGDAIQFVMDIEGLNYIETIKYLGKKYGIEIPEQAQSADDIRQETERESIFIALNFARDYYKDLLWENEDGQAIGMSYFKERGFREDIIKKFELGYSLDEFEAFYHKASAQNFNADILEKAGLIIKRDNANDSRSSKYFDRFRGRVMFPIHSLTGKVLGFGARILKTEKGTAKYLNSPESEVYHKSKILYGIFQAKNAIRNTDNCYLVEGYTDVLSLHQAGIENVVASSGTSLTVEQIRLIARYTQNITVLYDGDNAGIKASLRGIDLILEEGLNVSSVVFPDGDDPDSFVKKVGGSQFQEYIAKSKKDFITFKTGIYLQDAGNDPIKKAGVIRDIVESIAKIPDSIKRSVFFKQCSNLLDIDEQTLVSEYNKIVFKKRKEGQESPEIVPEEYIPVETIQEKTPAGFPVERFEREIVRLLVDHGQVQTEDIYIADLILELTKDITFKNPVYHKILEIAREHIVHGGGVRQEVFLQHEDQEIKKCAIDLLTVKYGYSPAWERFKIFIKNETRNLEKAIIDEVILLKRYVVQEMMVENRNSLKAAQEKGDMEEIENLLLVFMNLKAVDKDLAARRGIIVG